MNLGNDESNITNVKEEKEWEVKEELDILNTAKGIIDEEYIQNQKCVKSKDSVQEMSKRLKALYGLVTTVSLGLQAECVEQQAVECLECIAQCVWDIKTMADECYGAWQD